MREMLPVIHKAFWTVRAVFFAWRDESHMLIILILWITMITLVDPVGEFPINDDWAYAKSVRELVFYGKVIHPDWSAPNFVAQNFIGGIFCILFGFSYTTLRFSSLLLGVVGLVACYKLVREMSVQPRYAMAGTLAMMVNPIYFASCHTFMTDIPCFSWLSISLLYFSRALRTDNSTHLAVAALASSIAVMIRQAGLAIPIAFLCVYILTRAFNLKNIGRAVFPTAVCISLHLGYKVWLKADNQDPSMYGHQINQIISNYSISLGGVAWSDAVNLFYSFQYFGIFLAPLLLMIAPYLVKAATLRKVATCFIVSIFLWYLAYKLGMPRFPMLGNTLGQYGVGPFLQHGASKYWVPYSNILDFFWYTASMLSFVSGVALLTVLFMFFRMLLSDPINSETHVFAFYIVSFCVYIIPVFGVTYLFDRYLLLLFLLVTLCVIGSLSGRLDCIETHRQSNANMYCRQASIGLIGVYGFITVAMMHDYMAWNRARWKALDDLINISKVSPTNIDGGFEFNGTYLYSKNDHVPGDKGWWVQNNDFLIAFTKEGYYQDEGYAVAAAYSVYPWIPFSPRKIFVLHRDSDLKSMSTNHQ